jgi:hypothetical protein
MNEALSFWIGLIVCLLVAAIWMDHNGDIKREDFYRFCMVKKIELQDCVTPPKRKRADDENI